MKRLVIFNGLPGAGKTALSDYVSKKLGIPYFKVEGRELKALPEGSERCKYIEKKLRNYIASSNDIGIADNLSYPFYEYIKGRYKNFIKYKSRLEKILEPLYVIYFYLEVTPEEAVKRKSFISEFDKLILSNAIVFEDLLKSFGNNHADVYIEIDTEKYSLNEVKNKVLNYIKSYVYQIYEI